MIRCLPLGLLALAALGGCAGIAPASFSGAASPDALACALSEATAAGYSVKTAEAGVFFNAEKRRYEAADLLNVSVARGVLRVLATTEGDEDALRRVSQPPSQTVRRDAELVVERCTGAS